MHFGDAHPVYNNIRSLRTPASFYYPKLSTVGEACYIHHAIADFEPLLPLQLKQCRKDFCAFSDNGAYIVKVDKNFAIKSAYDSGLRRSADNKMFGYESIAKGTVFGFNVEIDDDASGFREAIVNALTGNRHIGRSRSAQYGWVKIEPLDSTCRLSKPSSHADKGAEVAVYADGRLIFFDKNGMPTFQPSPADLGIYEEGAKIDWTHSQVRTFQYAPWNFQRQAFDNDRCGIEKGSVFIVTLPAASATERTSAYVGAYQNEGFGRVIYNPDFLNTIPGKNGLSVLIFHEAQPEEESQKPTSTSANPQLINFLRQKQEKDKAERYIYDQVKAFVNNRNNLNKFKGERFASQWGTIRSIAMNSRPESIVKNIDDYLNHGVAKEKWDDQGRRNLLLTTLKAIPGDAIKEFAIDLSSEMAKKLRQEL